MFSRLIRGLGCQTRMGTYVPTCNKRGSVVHMWDGMAWFAPLAQVWEHLVIALGGVYVMTTKVGEKHDRGSEARKHIANRLVLARSIAGFSNSRQAFCDSVEAKSGYKITARQLGGFERGEMEVGWIDIQAIVITAEPPGGADFFLSPLTPKQREAWERAKTREL